MIPTYIDIPASVKAARTEQNAYGMVKTHADLARYDRVIAESKPELIIECGSHTGHSARWFSQRTRNVISIDIAGQIAEEIRGEATFLSGSSTHRDIVSYVIALAAGARVMVVLDSDHRAAHVAEEIRLYGPLVTPGCYLVVEDGIAEWMEEEDYEGPLHAIERELADNPAWRRDIDIEQHSPISMHPAGWWEKL